jgi:hypothetical protein
MTRAKRWDKMATFDSLPPSIRRVLRECRYSWPVDAARSLLLETGDENVVIATLLEADAQRLATKSRRYGGAR